MSGKRTALTASSAHGGHVRKSLGPRCTAEYQDGAGIGVNGQLITWRPVRAATFLVHCAGRARAQRISRVRAIILGSSGCRITPLLGWTARLAHQPGRWRPGPGRHRLDPQGDQRHPELVQCGGVLTCTGPGVRHAPEIHSRGTVAIGLAPALISVMTPAAATALMMWCRQ